MVTDQVADLLTRLRNAQVRGHKATRVSRSKMADRILAILKKEGFITDYFETAAKPKKGVITSFKEYEVVLKYSAQGRPGIASSKRVSKPGRRVYVSADDLPKVHCGLGVAIISTSQGVLTDREARRNKVGGEVLAEFI